MHHTAREQHMPAFLKWLTDNGVDLSALSIDKFEGVGYGLKAARDIEVSSCYELVILVCIRNSECNCSRA